MDRAKNGPHKQLKTNRKASFLASLQLEVRSPALHKGSFFFPPPSAGTSSLGNKRGNNCLRSRRAVCKVCLPSAAWNDDGNSGASCTRASAPIGPLRHNDNTLVFDAATATARSPSGERYPSDVDLLMCCAAHSGGPEMCPLWHHAICTCMEIPWWRHISQRLPPPPCLRAASNHVSKLLSAKLLMLSPLDYAHKPPPRTALHTCAHVYEHKA